MSTTLVTLERLDEQRIRVHVTGAPADAQAWANGWETAGEWDGTVSFNCMAYTDLTVTVVVTASGQPLAFRGSVADLRVGERTQPHPVSALPLPDL